MLRRVVCLLLVLTIPTPQLVGVGCCHGKAQPDGHGRMPHFHIGAFLPWECHHHDDDERDDAENGTPTPVHGGFRQRAAAVNRAGGCPKLKPSPSFEHNPESKTRKDGTKKTKTPQTSGAARPMV